MEKFKNKIRKKILDIGFDSVGFAKPKVDLKTSTEFKNFLNNNYHGEMKWLERHYEKKTNPKKVWEEVNKTGDWNDDIEKKYKKVLDTFMKEGSW